MARSQTHIDAEELALLDAWEVGFIPLGQLSRSRQRGVEGRKCPLLGGKTSRDKRASLAHIGGESALARVFRRYAEEMWHAPACHAAASREPRASLA